jgi:hypothetical protein
MQGGGPSVRDLRHSTRERYGALWRPSIEGIGPLGFGWETDMDTNSTIEILREASAKHLSDDQLDLILGGVGNVIASTYHKGDGNGEAAFYAGLCMGLMGF